MDEQNEAYLWNEMLPRKEKEQALECMHDMGEPKNNYETLWEKPDRKDCIMYDSIYRKFLEKAKIESERLISSCLGLEL